jgi:HD-like signal output (HDOD) protein
VAGRGRHALHLVRRFFAVLTARPLDPAERDEVDEWLSDADRDLFWSQAVADQRHALDTARRVGEVHPGRREVVRAALFHDVGKVRSRLGPVRRSLATLFAALRVPVPTRWQMYIDHGPIGAELLSSVGAEDLVVAFARVHPGPAPRGFDASVWQALLDADDG